MVVVVMIVIPMVGGRDCTDGDDCERFKSQGSLWCGDNGELYALL